VKDLVVPAPFATETTRREGAAGSAWIASLPALAARYCGEWELRPDGEPLHGYVGVVLPVTRTDGSPAALKLSWLDTESRDEPLALSTWNGQGAVLLLENAPEHGVMLLERLDSARVLETEPIDNAVEVAGGLLRRLAVPAPAGLGRSMRADAERWAEALPVRWRRIGEPFAFRLLDAAVGLCRELGPSAGNLLVNEDLHFGNVLAGSREPWLVIDPKVLAGDLEYAVAQLMWNRAGESTLDYRFRGIVEAAGLDADLARSWALVRAVGNWLWLAGPGAPAGDPYLAGVSALARWARVG
jgi:streptomycin 6-kinase